jgi:hypothetical protein
MRFADALTAPGMPAADLLALLLLLALVALGVGGLLGPRTGRWRASSITGGTIGFVTWWSLGWLWPALVAAVAAWLVTLAGTVLWFHVSASRA